MAIKRLDTNKYKIIIELGYDVLGNRRRKTETFIGSKMDAKMRETELKHSFNKNQKITDYKNMTFKELSEEFIKRYCEQNLSIITTKGYKTILIKINKIIGSYKINKITTRTLDILYSKLREDKNGNFVGYHSMYSYYKVINVIFNQAIKWEYMNNNPNLNANKPKREHKEKNFYDEEQVKKLLEVLDNEPIKYKTLIMLTLDSGARRAELCALRWSDIDFKTRIMNIDKSLKVCDNIVEEKRPKTESSIRKIILSNRTIEQLEKYKEWQEDFKSNRKTKWKSNKEDRIFTSIDGNYMHPSTCDKIIRKIVLKYNLPPICFHELRHTCCSLLINAGIDPKTVSSRLGHSDISITMEIYTHVFNKNKEKCADKFDELINSLVI